ncbi:hypothetical protein JCM6882_007421 [Rhodosporidiobolus microsporus]
MHFYSLAAVASCLTSTALASPLLYRRQTETCSPSLNGTSAISQITFDPNTREAWKPETDKVGGLTGVVVQTLNTMSPPDPYWNITELSSNNYTVALADSYSNCLQDDGDGAANVGCQFLDWATWSIECDSCTDTASSGCRFRSARTVRCATHVQDGSPLGFQECEENGTQSSKQSFSFSFGA